MYFKQFYLGCLAQASYMIGSDGEAAVVDPRRDVDIYIDEARAQGLTIRHVIETHLHADFVSGHRELAERTGAKIYFGAAARGEVSRTSRCTTATRSGWAMSRCGSSRRPDTRRNPSRSSSPTTRFPTSRSPS